MAKAVKNAIIRGISGSIGDLVFRQMPDGSTYISSKQDFSKRVFSKSQKDHQRRFKQAVEYARAAAKTQPIYAELAAGTIKSPYNWALSDWFQAPVIHRIERTANGVRVNATDNVKVAKVAVSILGEEGMVIEKGEAVQREGSEWWEYVYEAEGKVMVEVWDLAGNVVRKEL